MEQEEEEEEGVRGDKVPFWAGRPSTTTLTTSRVRNSTGLSVGNSVPARRGRRASLRVPRIRGVLVVGRNCMTRAASVLGAGAKEGPAWEGGGKGRMMGWHSEGGHGGSQIFSNLIAEKRMIPRNDRLHQKRDEGNVKAV